MKDTKHDLLIKLIAIGVGFGALGVLFGGFSDGAIHALWSIFLSLVLAATAVGFARYRGWAFLVVSALLLVGWMYTFIDMVVGIDADDRSGWSGFRGLVVCTVLIAYLGRWSVERHFRPHLDTAH